MATCILRPWPSPALAACPRSSESSHGDSPYRPTNQKTCPMWPVYLHAEYEGLQGSPGASLPLPLPLPSRPFVTGRYGVPSLDARVPRVALVCARLAQEPREIPLVCGRRIPGPTIHVDTTGDDWAVPSEVVPLPLALRQCWCAPRRVSVVLAGRARRPVAGPLDDSGSDLRRVPEGRDVARE